MTDHNKLLSESSQKRDFFSPQVCTQEYMGHDGVEGNSVGGGLEIYEGEKAGGHGIKLIPTNILSSLKLTCMWKNTYLPIT